jgi:hypothetical protein
MESLQMKRLGFGAMRLPVLEDEIPLISLKSIKG